MVPSFFRPGLLTSLNRREEALSRLPVLSIILVLTTSKGVVTAPATTPPSAPQAADSIGVDGRPLCSSNFALNSSQRGNCIREKGTSLARVVKPPLYKPWSPSLLHAWFATTRLGLRSPACLLCFTTSTGTLTMLAPVLKRLYMFV